MPQIYVFNASMSRVLQISMEVFSWLQTTAAGYNTIFLQLETIDVP